MASPGKGSVSLTVTNPIFMSTIVLTYYMTSVHRRTEVRSYTWSQAIASDRCVNLKNKLYGKLLLELLHLIT